MNDLIPTDYAETLEAIKTQVRDARLSAQRVVNTELLRLYWRIGQLIRRRLEENAWGSKIVEQLAEDLRREFPTMRGFSRSNLMYMRAFAAAWPDEASIVQQAAGQLPWTHIHILLDQLDDPAARDWYAARDVQHGWSRGVLSHQIATDLRSREGSAPSNFEVALPPAESDQAQELTKDPYALDFLALDSDARERELEDRLVLRIIDTLRELGAGYAFVGRQVHFDVDGEDFYVDLLFFHVEQLRYVVIELKTTRFDPRDAGQLGFYVALVDDRLRREQHQPTVGILLVASKSEAIVRYALAGTAQPIAVARYELAAAVRDALPDEASLTRAVREIAGEN